MIRKIFLLSLPFLYINIGFCQTKTLTVVDILNEHKKTVENSLLKSGKSTFKAESRLNHKVPDGYNPSYDSIIETYFVLHDSNRIDMRVEQKNFYDEIIIREYERQHLLDKGICCRIYRKPDESVPTFIYAFKEGSFREQFSYITVNAYMEGYSPEDYKYYWEILEEAENLKLRENMEVIDGHETYVLETKIPSLGQYTLWIDPAFGYNIRKLVIKRTGDDLSGQELREGGDPSVGPFISFIRKEAVTTLNSVEIEQIGDIYVPVSGVLNEVTTYSNGEQMIEESKYKRYEINLNPDFSKYPDAFILDAPDGTPVHYAGYMESGIPFEWLNGKIVPKVDLPTLEDIDANSEQIIENGDVPAKLGNVKDSEIIVDESNNVLNNNYEPPKILEETDSSILRVIIPVGLLIIGFVGWKIFRKPQNINGD